MVNSFYLFGRRQYPVVAWTAANRTVKESVSQLFSRWLFPGSTIDGAYFRPERDAAGRERLADIGGRAVQITGNGQTLDAMTFLASDFNEYMSAVLEAAHFQPTKEDSHLLIAPEYSEGMQRLIELGLISKTDDSEGYQFVLPETKGKGGTVIICPGWTAQFSVYQGLVATLLYLGANVVAFNWSGHGQSTGTPTEQQIKDDASAVYDYVEKHIPSSPLCVYANCGGAIPGVALVAAHPGTHLILDRAFDRFSHVVAPAIFGDSKPKVKERVLAVLAEWGTSYLVSTSVAGNLSQVKGKVLMITSASDKLVGRAEQLTLASAIVNNDDASISEAIVPVGHFGSWLGDPTAQVKLESFLVDAGIISSKDSDLDEEGSSSSI